jgi:ribose/xylose/arabinose/galactoside ABC-type transport system permease subunit
MTAELTPLTKQPQTGDAGDRRETMARPRLRIGANTLMLGTVCAVVLALLFTMYVEAPTFFRVNNLINILVQASIVGILAVGLTFV